MQPYHYHLPPELIAQTAAEPRDSARLLRWPQGTETPFHALPTLLPANAILVVNNSKVIPARLFATRPGRTSGQAPIPVELLLHRPLASNLSQWQVFAKPARRLKAGDVLTLAGGAQALVTAVSPQPAITLHLPPEQIPTYLETHGHTPLPTYIKVEDTPQTRARYQTVYADATQPGSVAAPTAGLHFTPEVLAALAAKGIQTHHVTLHVGAGTFLNPTPEQLASGQLHAEWMHVPASTAQALKSHMAAGHPIVVVGTTALRTLESWANLGAPAAGVTGDTTLFIRPGYRFQVATHLITNFHLPGSSLLMLVAAFIGEASMAKLYTHAIKNRFRFYSFGDTSLLERQA